MGGCSVLFGDKIITARFLAWQRFSPLMPELFYSFTLYPFACLLFPPPDNAYGGKLTIFVWSTERGLREQAFPTTPSGR